MEVFTWKLVPHSPPRASAPLPLTLPLCCSERCSVRVRVMSSTLDAPYTWGKMKKGLKDRAGVPTPGSQGLSELFLQGRVWGRRQGSCLLLSPGL